MEIPTSHPRFMSLYLRERMAKGVEDGLVAPSGLAAHGRGEAFDYLLGEKTIPEARKQAKTGAAALLLADSPVISVNGNSSVIALDETIELAKIIGAKIEVNLFHPSEERADRLVSLFERNGARNVLGRNRDSTIPGLDHDRGRCSTEGIFSADTVLVLLEDGDRTKALREMGKCVIAVDLNPLSRTARSCNIPLVDNVIRALPCMSALADEMKKTRRRELQRIVDSFEPGDSLGTVVEELIEGLRAEFRP